LSAAVIVAAVAAIVVIAAATGGAAQRVAKAEPLGLEPLMAHSLVAPEPTSACQTSLGTSCYSPAQFENAYDLGPLHSKGVDGSGITIAIVDSFGSPTIASDLHQFDQTFGQANAFGVPADPAILQDPNLTIIQPADGASV
jgi:subtilase family serine protease